MEQIGSPQVPPVSGQGAAGQGDGSQAGSAAPAAATPWYQELGFRDEASAKASFKSSQQKISELGMENSRLRTGATPQQQQAAPEQGIGNVSFEEFMQNPSGVLTKAAALGSRMAVQEMSEQQRLQNVLEDAARREGVEKWEVQQVYADLYGNDFSKAVDIMAGVAKMKKQGDPSEEIRRQMEQDSINKGRASAAPTGTHLQSPSMLTEDQLRGMSYPDIQKAMAEGRVAFT